ncbi:MAG: SEC-C metal-binding domain-containing protein [Microthrixaceae bacterium]
MAARGLRHVRKPHGHDQPRVRAVRDARPGDRAARAAGAAPQRLDYTAPQGPLGEPAAARTPAGAAAPAGGAAPGPAGGHGRGPATAEAEQPAAQNAPVVRTEWEKTPRNAPCPCGSGKKYKQCHGAN